MKSEIAMSLLFQPNKTIKTQLDPRKKDGESPNKYIRADELPPRYKHGQGASTTKPKTKPDTSCTDPCSNIKIKKRRQAG
jgi:hypothetical protein